MRSQLCLFLSCFTTANGLSLVGTSRQRALPGVAQHPRASAWCLAASKEDEIRELEEKLQRLKEETKDEESIVEQAGQDVKLNDEAIYTELLTEQWKESDPEQKGESSIVQTTATVFATVGLVVVLALFSQVPVGQEDLSRFSAVQTPSAQIDLGDLNRARSGGDV
jgi:hypothetical protein